MGHGEVNIIYFPLKMKFASIALLGVAAATSKHNQVMLYNLMQLEEQGAPACPPPLAITEDELHYQLGEFSRNFDQKNWAPCKSRQVLPVKVLPQNSLLPPKNFTITPSLSQKLETTTT